MRVKGPGQLWGWVLLGDSASGSATTCCLHHPGHASDPSGPMARGPWVTEAAIKGNVIVSTLRVTNLKLRDAARNLAKTLSCLINTFPHLAPLWSFHLLVQGASSQEPSLATRTEPVYPWLFPTQEPLSARP